MRDVLYLLIGYSERAYELLHRPLSTGEQRELYDVFGRVGRFLGVVGLPGSYEDWQVDRARHLAADLSYGRRRQPSLPPIDDSSAAVFGSLTSLMSSWAPHGNAKRSKRGARVAS